jgi:sec-independent protein translocase protein TatC
VLESEDERQMPVLAHLGELRRALIISLGAWAVASAVSAALNRFLIAFLEAPLKPTLARQSKLLTAPIVTSPTELFTIPLKVALVGGLVLALPVVLWQVWAFVSPGLRPAERRLAAPLILSGLLLFAAGACLAYFLMPIWLGILTSLIGGNAVYFPDLDAYLSFFVMLIVVFGLTFELPLVIVLLGLARVVSSGWLRRRRKVVWVGIIVAAELVTPGADPFTPLFLALPLLALYELSIVVLGRALRR